MALVPLDQVLRLSARAIEAAVEPFGRAVGDVGDDVTGIETLPGRLDPRHDAAGMRPGFGGVADFREVAQHIEIGGRPPGAHFIGLGEDLGIQDRILDRPKTYRTAFRSHQSMASGRP